MKLRKGDVIGIYEGDLIGWIPVRLKKLIFGKDGKQKWLVSTFYGDKLERYVSLDSKERYSFIDDVLDIYVWDNVMRRTVATATFEQDYWIEINGETKAYSEPKDWYLDVKKYFRI